MAAREQLQEYLRRLASKNRVNNLAGLLILGTSTEVYELTGPHANADAVYWRTFATNGVELEAFIRSVASDNWN